MKKILFVAQSLKIGGIERALVEQLNALDSSKYEVDLFLFSCSGPYCKDLSPNVRILRSNWLLEIVGKTQKETKNNWIAYIVRLCCSLLARIMGSKRLFTLIYRFSTKFKGYDTAISYVHDGSNKSLYYGCNLFVLKNVTAKERIAWIHSDYVGLKLNNPETTRWRN